MRAVALFVALLLCNASVALGQSGVQKAEHRVVKDENVVRLIWQMAEETGVQAYEVRRGTTMSNGNLVIIGKPLLAHGVNRIYEYVDRELYKEGALSVAEYEVSAVLANGERRTIFSEKLNYTSTGVRRTWGSIKAMFQ